MKNDLLQNRFNKVRLIVDILYVCVVSLLAYNVIIFKDNSLFTKIIVGIFLFSFMLFYLLKNLKWNYKFYNGEIKVGLRDIFIEIEKQIIGVLSLCCLIMESYNNLIVILFLLITNTYILICEICRLFLSDKYLLGKRGGKHNG